MHITFTFSSAPSAGKNLSLMSWVLDIPSTWKEKEEARISPWICTACEVVDVGALQFARNMLDPSDTI